jgi:hypothetical protein
LYIAPLSIDIVGFFILFFSLEDIGTLLVYYWYNNIIQPTPDSTHNTMVKTLSSRAIRLRYQGKNASSQDPGSDTEQGPRKRGRKKKKMHWQQLKRKAAEDEKMLLLLVLWIHHQI